MRENIPTIAYKYKTEPSLKTVYVEGPADLVFYRKCFSALNINTVAICDIATVDTSTLDFKSLDLDPKSNRDKVCAFIYEINSKYGLSVPLGIIDGDFDHVLQKQLHYKGVHVTDASCAEAYFWERPAFVDFFDRITKNQFSKHSNIVGGSLNSLFALRLVNREYCVEMTGNWLDKFSLENSFNYRDYVRNIIIRAERTKEISIDEFCSKIEIVIDKIPSHHVAINGHDMVDLICHLINRFNNKKSITDPSILLQMIYSLECYPEITSMPMFNRLSEELNSRTISSR